MTGERDKRGETPLSTLTGAEESVELRRDYLHNLVHELSTPLTPLLGYLKLFQKGSLGETTALQKRCVDRMNRSAKRLHRILEDLGYLLQMESGMYHPQPRPIDMHGLIERVVAETCVSAEEEQIEVLLDIDADVQVNGDEPRLTAALCHLIGNGLKFNTAGGKLLVRSTVTNCEDRREGRAVVRIELFDTGIGIKDDELDRVFDSFYQVDHSSTRKFGGSGLGLALARWIIRAHNGEIRLESPPSIQPEGHFFRGVRVIVELPVLSE